MKDFLIKNFSTLLIAALVLFLWSKGTPAVQAPIILRDTAYVIGQAPQREYTPGMVITVPATTIPPQYKPDTSYMGVLRQYQELLSNFLAKNATNDTLHLRDSSGKEFATVPLQDTVTTNKITDRKWSYTYRFPVITNTITKTAPPKTKLYYGFELTSPIGPVLGIQQAEAGLLLKNKKENILKGSIGLDFHTLRPLAKIGYYKNF